MGFPPRVTHFGDIPPENYQNLLLSIVKRTFRQNSFNFPQLLVFAIITGRGWRISTALRNVYIQGRGGGRGGCFYNA